MPARFFPLDPLILLILLLQGPSMHRFRRAQHHLPDLVARIKQGPHCSTAWDFPHWRWEEPELPHEINNESQGSRQSFGMCKHVMKSDEHKAKTRWLRIEGVYQCIYSFICNVNYKAKLRAKESWGRSLEPLQEAVTQDRFQFHRPKNKSSAFLRLWNISNSANQGPRTVFRMQVWKNAPVDMLNINRVSLCFIVLNMVFQCV